VLVTFLLPTGAMVSVADVPPTQVGAPFNEPKCAGDTEFDPTDTSDAVVDTTLVFGKRLADYNAGKVVVLYDSYGGSPTDAYPPLCGTRYVAGSGAVSEWMFCTDIHSEVCGGTAVDGGLVGEAGSPLHGLDALTGNSRLDPGSADKEKLIAYLIQNGHSYDDTGVQGTTYGWDGVTEAVADATGPTATDQCDALQTLIWCISDPIVQPAVGTEVQREVACQNNMNSAEQARLLALIPDAPSVTLSFGGSSAGKVGDSVTMTLSTNLYGQPITVATSGVVGDLAVCGGTAGATLSNGVLTLPPGDPVVAADVLLCLTSTAAGTMTVSASALPASRLHLAWNQSPDITTSGKACQVFATFNAVKQLGVSSTTSATFIVPNSGQRAAELPDTGSAPAGQLIVGLLVLVLGVVFVIVARRRAKA
jgi:LPXTG-motif cell wall-anchored protein